MPNYTKNVCTIIGAKEKVESIINKIVVTKDYIKEMEERNATLGTNFRIEVTEEDLNCVDFNRLIPTPSHIYQASLTRDVENLYGKENCWLEWCTKHWGTKWNASETEINYFDKGVEVSFWTAWTAPTPFIEKLATLCYELGCEFSCDFADEDFGGLMGTFNLTDDGNILGTCCDCDREHYAKVWGEENLPDEV